MKQHCILVAVLENYSFIQHVLFLLLSTAVIMQVIQFIS